jgi:hypothetical protein
MCLASSFVIYIYVHGISSCCRCTVFFFHVVKHVKLLQFFITPTKLMSPFRGQLAFDLLWAPEPLNGVTGPGDAAVPTSRGLAEALRGIYWGSQPALRGGGREQVLAILAPLEYTPHQRNFDSTSLSRLFRGCLLTRRATGLLLSSRTGGGLIHSTHRLCAVWLGAYFVFLFCFRYSGQREDFAALH